MTDSAVPNQVEPDPDLSRRAAIVGIGETDFAADYRAARRKEPGYLGPDGPSLAKLAFERALEDCGLRRDDIDGLSLTLMYGEGDADAMSDLLGIAPRYRVGSAGLSPVPAAAAAIASGRCDTIALVYSAASRSIARRYGGATYTGGGTDSYYYYHPWGWSSQAAHWALIWRYYMSTYGATEADLGAVVLALRQSAILNDNAIMRDPLTIEDYLESRYIVKPLHLFDMCLVNDGGVCLILRRADRAGDGPHTPVLVAGWADAEVTGEKMRLMVRERLRPLFDDVVSRAMSMAGATRSDIGHLEVYDASSVHLLNQLEGYGFVEPGEGIGFVKDGNIAIGGSLPVNTNGGMLSQAYMHAWNNMAEVVKQLRHEAGPRQVKDLEMSLFSLATTESAHPVVLARGR